MGRVFKSKIYWLTKEQSGRNTLPYGDKYCPVIIVKGSEFNPHNEVWSVFVVNKSTIGSNETLSEVRYLSDNAPDNLHIGVEFKIYEGNKMVAYGTILQ